MTFDWSCGELAEGLGCYRRGEFFAAHEHWELVWLACEEPEKTFLQALIQVAAALHHLQRDNLRGTTSLLKTALRKLEAYPAEFEGVAVAALRDEVRGWVEVVLESQEGLTNRPRPRIRVEGVSAGSEIMPE